MRRASGLGPDQPSNFPLAYHSGFRRGEILGLTWDMVDLKEGTITLPGDVTKNKRPRVLHMNTELLAEMKALHSERRFDCACVFHRNGESVKDFREAWEKACITAGLCEPLIDSQGRPIKTKKGDLVLVANKLLHDFRRTAVRNMVRAGIPEKVAMEISGHQTPTVFERYNISSQEDLKEAARKQDAYWESEKVTGGAREGI